MLQEVLKVALYGMAAELIAPCGMNCRLCSGYIRTQNPCTGCKGNAAQIYAYCSKCIIRNCSELKHLRSGFCYECEKYPCKRLKALDKRYTSKYNMSMLENLGQIRDKGMDEFLKSQSQKWTCEVCGFVLCVHKGSCPNCNK